jgi:hypothetical protein
MKSIAWPWSWGFTWTDDMLWRKHAQPMETDDSPVAGAWSDIHLDETGVGASNSGYHTYNIFYSVPFMIFSHGGFHFIITSDNKVWLHDGIETKDRCQYNGKLDTYNDSDLLT